MVRARAVPLDVHCGPASWTAVTGWQNVVLGLAVCLPIPALALSGLALPLPAVVYRAAVAIVETTQDLAGVFTGDDADAGSSPAPRPGVSRQQRLAEPSATPRRVATGTASARVTAPRLRPAAPAGTPSFGAAPTKRSAGLKRSAEPVRTSTVPPAEARTDVSDKAAATAAPQAPVAAPEVKNEQRPSFEPSPRPANVSPVEPAPIEPPASPPPVPSPPPAPTPEPGLLDPVTKPLEPVTSALEPVTKPLSPVTNILQPITKPLER